jgi:hypothetical protein
MTTYLEGMDELVTALETAGLSPTLDAGAAAPCTLVMPYGIPALTSRRQSEGVYRLTMLAGAWSVKGSHRTLATMIGSFASVFAALPGWGVGPIEPPARFRLANGEALGAAVTVSRMIDYPEA